ncbi:hypothetical protein PR048_012733, partial [Dryococelus australis]
MELVYSCGKTQYFQVYPMTHMHFHEYSELYRSTLHIKKNNDYGERFYWMDVKWLRYVKGSKVFLYRGTLYESTDFKKILAPPWSYNIQFRFLHRKRNIFFLCFLSYLMYFTIFMMDFQEMKPQLFFQMLLK